MRLRRHVQDDGLALEEVHPGSPMTPPLYLEFHCPGCDEFHSVTCDCATDHDDTFLCDCVPPECPGCGYQLRAEVVSVEGDPILLGAPSYK